MSKQMIGTAQIIIKDKRLIETFVEPISKIIRSIGKMKKRWKYVGGWFVGWPVP